MEKAKKSKVAKVEKKVKKTVAPEQATATTEKSAVKPAVTTKPVIAEKGSGAGKKHDTKAVAKVEVKAVKAKKTTTKEPVKAEEPLKHTEIEKAILASPAITKSPKERHADLINKARHNARLVSLPVYNPATMRKSKQDYSAMVGLLSKAMGVKITGEKNYRIMAHFGMYYTASGQLCTEFFGKHTMYLPYVEHNLAQYAGWVYHSLEKSKPEDWKAVFDQMAKVYEVKQSVIFDKVVALLKDCKKKSVPVLVGTIKQSLKTA